MIGTPSAPLRDAHRPVLGTRVRVEFTEMSNGRRAVAHVGSWTVAVEDAVPGDVADVELRERRGAAYRGHLLALVRPSPHRVRPACSYFERCGGCQWQRLDTAAQAEYKGTLVRRALRAVGLGGVPVRVVPARAAWGYRTAGTYVPAVDGGSAALGLHAADAASAVAIRACPIQSPALQAAFDEMQRAWCDLILRLDDADGDRSAWRQIRIRAGEASREVAVGLVHAGRLSPRARAAVVELIGGRITRLVEITVKPARRPARTGEPMSELRWGRAGVVEAMLDRWYHVPVFAPFPVSGRGDAVAAAVDALAPDGETTVLETEAGIGAYTLPAAAAARRVIGRTTGEHLQTARENARWNEASNVIFADRTAETLTRMLRSYGPVGRALVQVTPAPVPFETLHRAGLERVVLLAGSPARLAEVLTAGAPGFEARSITVVDTHPQTSRAEIHAVLDARHGAWAGADYVTDSEAAPTAASTEPNTGQRDAKSTARRIPPTGDSGAATR
ncbi:MAG TPA: hypothetical protein VFL28_02530 [bacterium]|nr:hypothetical protein [bacterium]